VLTVRDAKGRETLIQSLRIASMANPHIAALQYSVSPINYSGTITIKSLLDGDLINDGVARYRDLNQHHLKSGEAGGEGMLSWLRVSTTQSAIDIALAARLKTSVDNIPLDPEMTNEILHSAVASSFSVKLEKFQVLKVEKNVAIYTSKPDDTDKPLHHAKVAVMVSGSYQELLKESRSAWDKIWEELDLKVEGDRFAQKLLRLHLYHLMVSFSIHNKDLDAGITARGLHGEAYRGHIFWDELFILPLYALHFKDAARAMLMYRYRRLDAARIYAKQHGRRGAMFPWQSGSDGREETQVIHLNPVSGEWGDDYSSLQRHVSLAIAYNIWQYLRITADTSFIQDYGAEMFFEICRFWASMTYEDKTSGRLSIKNVMGPDEFHESYPDATEGGLKDNAYTNLMVVWTLERAAEMLEMLDEEAVAKIKNQIGLTTEETDRWEQITHRLNLVINDDIISQYDGYFDLDELDWDSYRKKYDNIYRLDRLLKAEGDSADHYKVAKQADTLMTFYALPVKEVDHVLEHLGYHLSGDYLNKNLHYYLQRTSHGSTLSRVVHAQLANMIGDSKLSWELYSDALASDYTDIQGGTTGEGIHAGVMAGTVLIAQQSYAGVDVRGEIPLVNPKLPAHWRGISFNIRWRNHRLWFEITRNLITIKKTGAEEKLRILVAGEEMEMTNDAFISKKY
jgi:trehalose/maltose hydrolase-like predicted phosphorylase